jgi:hypothetical protein
MTPFCDAFCPVANLPALVAVGLTREFDLQNLWPELSHCHREASLASPFHAFTMFHLAAALA